MNTHLPIRKKKTLGLLEKRQLEWGLQLLLYSVTKTGYQAEVKENFNCIESNSNSNCREKTNILILTYTGFEKALALS